MPLIFISYSHHDTQWRAELQLHLKPFFNDADDVLVWDDQQIKAGDMWQEKISQALKEARVAVLLVTPNFLASEFIMREELPILIEARKKHQLELLWIPVQASAFEETNIREFQALSNPKWPLSSLNDNDRVSKLVDIARKIRDAVQETIVDPLPENLMQPLRSDPVRLAAVTISVPDPKGRVWVSNGQQLRVFSIDPGRQPKWRILPSPRWKQHLKQVWRDQLVLSDWDGNLHAFAPQEGSGDSLLYQARRDDLPIHLIETGEDGRLVTAAWNGCIRAWVANGAPSGTAFEVPRLPLAILPLPDEMLAVADQANTIRIYDLNGVETWRWQPTEPIRQMWSCSGEARPALAVWLGRSRLAKATAGRAEMETQDFEEPILSTAMFRGQGGLSCLAVAREGGFIDWLPLSPFGLLRGSSVRINDQLRQLVDTRGTSQVPSALGLTEDGRLVVAHQSQFSVYEKPREIQRLIVDPGGQFLFLLIGDRLELHRNPIAGRPQSKVELVRATGKLEQDTFRKLTIELKNLGDIAIHRVTAELNPPSNVEPCRRKAELSPAAQRGDVFTLEFSVRALVSGDAVPLTLTLLPEDLGGPWAAPIQIELNVESIGTGRSR